MMAAYQYGMLRAVLILVVAIIVPAQPSFAAPNSTSLEARIARLERVTDSRAQLQLAQRIDEMLSEIQQLRGAVELTTQQIEQLSERQRQLYADLDRRLSELTSQSASKIQSQQTPARVPLTQGQGVIAPPAQDDDISNSTTSSQVKNDAEKGAYQQAYALMKDKHYRQAALAYTQLIEQYPQGQYAPNALYWLGEVRLVLGDAKQAQNAFQTVIDRFPKHQKAADALLKLGYAYLAQGDNNKARSTFVQVSSHYQGTAVARLANARLATMTPPL